MKVKNFLVSKIVHYAEAWKKFAFLISAPKATSNRNRVTTSSKQPDNDDDANAEASAKQNAPIPHALHSGRVVHSASGKLRREMQNYHFRVHRLVLTALSFGARPIRFVAS